MKSLTFALCAVLLLASASAQFLDTDKTCGGNCKWEDCDSCVCGDKPNSVNVTEICASVGVWDQKCCECIINTSSNGNSNSILDGHDGTFDVGLFHINTYNWAKCNAGNAPCDVDTNVGCAKMLYEYANNTWINWVAAGPSFCDCLPKDIVQFTQ